MNATGLIHISGLLVPLISAVIGLIVTMVFITGRRHPLERRLSQLLLVNLSACAVCWACLILYSLVPTVFIMLKPLFYLCILCAQVTTYHYLFTLTCVDNAERFPKIHYLVPAIICVLLLVWSAFVPVDVQLLIAGRRDNFPEGYEAYSAIILSNRYMFLVYNILYSALGLRRLAGFGKALGDYSADEGKSSVRWLRSLVYVTLATLPLSAIPALLGADQLVSTAITFVPILFLVLKDVILVYNTVAVNYVVIEDLSPALNAGSDAADTSLSAALSADREAEKKRFERYIRTQKPYLNPQLRITDITVPLKTNRTYLSAFINQEYGMNFSRYINRLRLQELERIRAASDMSHISGLELVQLAGFSNFRAYLRVKRDEERATRLRIDGVYGSNPKTPRETEE